MKLFQAILILGMLGLAACTGGSSGGGEPKPSTFNSSLFVKTSAVPAGAECPNGGISVESGLDNNGNQVLDQDEIVETQIVCNGENGTNGNDGSNGLNSLVSVTDEPVGVNCGAGGKKIDVGLDSNGSNSLDANEITSTQYVCHGITGTGGGAANTNCIIVTAADNSTQLRCGDQSVVLVPGNVVPLVTEVNPIAGGFEIIDAWQSSGGRNRFSFRNPHYFVDVLQDGDITIDITSNSPDYIYLVDDLGIVAGEISNGLLTRTVTAGTYSVVAATINPNVSENFTMQILGNVANPRKVSSDYLMRTDTWAYSGGRNVNTFRNHHYTFTTERATYLDVRLESSVATSLFLVNSQGFTVASYGAGALVGEIHVDLPTADTYRLVAATHNPGVNANYTLEMYGQFVNFTKTASDMLGFQDSWSNSGGRNPESFRNDHYTVTIPSKTYLDVLLESSVAVSLYLIDSQGITVTAYGAGAAIGQVNQALDPGTYTLVAATHNPSEVADYTLQFVGHFTSIVKTIPSPVTQLNGAWVNSAGRNSESYRNNHYSFTADTDTYVDIVVTSSVAVSLYLVDSLGITRASYGAGTATGQINTKIIADNYTLVVATHNPGISANYTLEMHGQYSNFAPIAAQTLSTIGGWTSSGGAVTDSPNNPRYSITVTQDSYIDIMIESSVTNYLYLLNDLGNIELQGANIAGNVPAGNYTIVAATAAVNQVSNYSLTVVGQVTNLVAQ